MNLNKILNLRITSLLFLIIIFTSCRKKEKDVVPTMYMSWTVDGKEEKATAHTAVLIGGTSVVISGSYYLSPNGRDTGTHLAIPNSLGTYDAFSSADSKPAKYVIPNGPELSQEFIATSGTITVTSLNKVGNVTTMVGYFNFIGSDGTSTRNISNGKFSVNYE